MPAESQLEFYTGGKVVGYFLTDAYPTRPGRYLFAPYRGEGHAILESSLENRNQVQCSFPQENAEATFVVVQQIFIPAKPRSCWFVDIIKLEVAGVILTTEQDGYRQSLLPVSCLAADVSHRKIKA